MEAVPQVAQERMIQVFQHPSLSYDVPHALAPHHLIFPDIFERERQTRVLALHYPHFAESPLADDSEKTEVIEVDFIGEDNGLAIGIAHLRWRSQVCLGNDGWKLCSESQRICWLDPLNVEMLARPKHRSGASRLQT